MASANNNEDKEFSEDDHRNSEVKEEDASMIKEEEENLDARLMTHKYRGSQQSSRVVLPNLLIRHKGSQRINISLDS
jgi:hypothetical protein